MNPQSLIEVAQSLIAYRQQRGCSAEVVVRMALKIGYDAGSSAGYEAGRGENIAAMIAAADSDETDSTDEPGICGVDW